MSICLNRIKYETSTHFVQSCALGYEVYIIGCTHSTRCAIIGHSGKEGLERAIKECNSRSNK